MNLKKFEIILLLLFLLPLFLSCAKKTDNVLYYQSRAAEITGALVFDGNFDGNGYYVKIRLSERTDGASERDIEMEFVYPEDLKGYTLKRSGGGNTEVTFMGLTVPLSVGINERINGVEALFSFSESDISSVKKDSDGKITVRFGSGGYLKFSESSSLPEELGGVDGTVLKADGYFLE